MLARPATLKSARRTRLVARLAAFGVHTPILAHALARHTVHGAGIVTFVAAEKQASARLLTFVVDVAARAVAAATRAFVATFELVATSFSAFCLQGPRFVRVPASDARHRLVLASDCDRLFCVARLARFHAAFFDARVSTRELLGTRMGAVVWRGLCVTSKSDRVATRGNLFLD